MELRITRHLMDWRWKQIKKSEAQKAPPTDTIFNPASTMDERRSTVLRYPKFKRGKRAMNAKAASHQTAMAPVVFR